MLKKKILVAEDDEDDQHFFKAFSQDRNDIMLMPIAENGIVAIELLERITNPAELPDHIILDQNMPKRNGLQTLQLLKADSRYAHIPVTIYSTYTDERLIKNAAELGACRVIAKPISRAGYDNMMTVIFETC